MSRSFCFLVSWVQETSCFVMNFVRLRTDSKDWTTCFLCQCTFCTPDAFGHHPLSYNLSTDYLFRLGIKLLPIDQILKKNCFRKSHLGGNHTGRRVGNCLQCKANYLVAVLHFPNIVSPFLCQPVQFWCLRDHWGISTPPRLSYSTLAPNSESTFSMCQKPAAVSPLSELRTYSNSSDQEFIFSNTGQDCMELYPKNIRCRAQRQQKNELVQFYFTCISTEAWSYSSWTAP